VAIKTELLTGWFIVRVVMTDKTWEEQEKEAQNHYDLVLEVAKLREQNKQMKQLLKTIYETDCLPDWAYGKGDDGVSIAEMVRGFIYGEVND